MDENLGYKKHSVEGNNSGNSRNGYNHKTIISDYGESEIAVPICVSKNLFKTNC